MDVTRRWLRLAARLPGARARLAESHDRLMTAGGANLARLLAEPALHPKAVTFRGRSAAGP